MKLLLTVCLLAVVAQTQPNTIAPLQFEAAVFKHSAPNDTRPDVLQRLPNRYSGVNTPLQAYIQIAYQVRFGQIAGPSWIMTERYDLEAKAERPSTPDELRVMLQLLLEERLNIKLRHDIVEQSGYSLVVDKGNPKLSKHDAADSFQHSSVVLGPDGAHDFKNMTMPYFAFFLSRQIDQAVVDNTGLDGAYDFSMRWSSGPTLLRHAGFDEVVTVDGPGPTVFEAIREVGLKLVASKVPVDHLMITHIEKIPVEK